MTDDRRQREAGFTLVEVLLVIVIIGILSLGVVMGVKGRSRQAAINTTRISISSIVSAVDAFEIDNGAMPNSLNELVVNSGHPSWHGPYIRNGKVPTDVWGTAFQFSVSENSVKIVSAGPDRQQGTGDDITN